METNDPHQSADDWKKKKQSGLHLHWIFAEDDNRVGEALCETYLRFRGRVVHVELCPIKAMSPPATRQPRPSMLPRCECRVFIRVSSEPRPAPRGSVFLTWWAAWAWPLWCQQLCPLITEAYSAGEAVGNMVVLEALEEASRKQQSPGGAETCLTMVPGFNNFYHLRPA